MSQQNNEDGLYREQDVLHFPEGLVGLPSLQRWILVDMDPPLPMKWLRSLDREGFRVPVTDPGFYTDQYGFEIGNQAQGLLEASDEDDIVVMIISTVYPDGRKVTGNLSAPLVVNTANRRGVQLVLENDVYGMRAEIDRDRFGAACAAYRDGHPENVVGTAVDKVMPEQYSHEREDVPSEEELIDAR